MGNRAVWAEINLGAVAHNFREIKKCIKGGAKLCAVVKANAYGHGAVPVAHKALEAGAYYLAVATVPEALELRGAGITAPILILGIVPEEAACELVEHNITQAVCDMGLAKAISAEAVRQGKCARVHLKVETGMERIGVRPEEAISMAKEIFSLPHVELEGLFSHFAAADEKDKSYVQEQLALFRRTIDGIEGQGIRIPLKHIAESAAILEIPEAHFDMVRAGIIEYGLWPSAEVSHPVELRQAMKLQARVAFLKTVHPGESIGYGRQFVASRESRIATLPIGYADGYIRAYGPKGEVEIHGRRVPIAGRVCMDQVMVDVTDLPEVQVGDIATLFGSETLTIDEAAKWLGTINYEVTCLVSGRVPRIYCET
ncbi:MAG: alanine racemase [Selenomonadaceae bacterium]|nr:alanine racemase [Selenomonadaceae bacterium]